MGKISEKIDEIIAERQKQLPLIQAAREKAMSAEDKMRAFRMFQKGMFPELDCFTTVRNDEG